MNQIENAGNCFNEETKNYFDKLEDEDAKIFASFNEKMKFFKDLKFNKKGSVIDAIAIDRKNRKVHIEIKQRTKKYSDFTTFAKQFPTIFLDTGKLDCFSKIISSGATLNEQELFVSIFNKGNIIIIHNLLEEQPIAWHPKQRLFNPGTKQWEYEHRIGLFWRNGMIFSKQPNGNYKQWTKEEIEDFEYYFTTK